MKLWMLGLAFLSTFAFAAGLPVDDEIASLRAKADYLDRLKTLFEKNACTVTVDGNSVGLAASALRSEGLVIAVGNAFPGNWLAYHQAPKPEQLARVVESTLQKSGAGKGARILSGQLYSKNSADYTHLVVYVAEPFLVKGADGLWLYNKTNVALKLNGAELTGSAQGKSSNGATVSLECKPR